MKFLHPSGSRPLEGYTIKRGIGRGGFGEVYYAVSDGGKEVALKLIRRNLDIELRGVMQCLNLKHPHLLTLYDVRRDDEGDTWVVMEYVAGQSLEDVVARHPQGLPRDDVLRWMHGIGAGVAYLHDRGIVHRDLKPGNIFWDEGVVKLGDYGLSKFISASRRSGQTESVGTVHYMAPEVANGRYGKEIDVYALGIMLYEVLTGHVPFEGESIGEVLMKHLTAQPDLGRLDEPFRSVVARALEKDPQRRLKSVGEMLALLPAAPAGGSWTDVPLPLPLAGEAAGAGVAAAVEEGVVGAAGAPGARGAGYSPPPLPEAARWGQPGAAPAGVYTATHADEEPIWRAVKQNWRDLKQAWDAADFSLPLRILLIVVGIFALLASAGIWAPALVLGVLTYGIYRVARSILRTGSGAHGGPAPLPAGAREAAAARAAYAAAEAGHAARGGAGNGAGPGPVAAEVIYEGGSSTRPHRDAGRPMRYEPAEPDGPPLSSRERSIELVGSLLTAALLAAVLSVGLSLLFGNTRDEQLAWLTITSIVGTWGVLLPSYYWAHDPKGDATARRVVLLAAGLIVGACAWGVEQVLTVDPHVSVLFTGSRNPRPALLETLSFFALVLLVPRWWRLAYPLRRHRLMVWEVFGCGLVAYVASLLTTFPSGLGLGVAVVMAVSIQLASPWHYPRRRRLRRAA